MDPERRAFDRRQFVRRRNPPDDPGLPAGAGERRVAERRVAQRRDHEAGG
jgi:hypothetical protein